VFHISIWGLGALFGGAKPTKAPRRRDWPGSFSFFLFLLLTRGEAIVAKSFVFWFVGVSSDCLSFYTWQRCGQV